MRKYIVVLAVLPAVVLGLTAKAWAGDLRVPPTLCHGTTTTTRHLRVLEDEQKENDNLRRIPPFHCPTTTTSTSTTTSTTSTTVASTITTAQQNITVNVAPAPVAVVAQPTFTG